MAVKFLISPFETEFRNFLKQAEHEIVLSSPYINDGGASILINSSENSKNKSIHILTNLSVKNIVDNVTQPLALIKISDAFGNSTISSLAKLHAKVYIIDEKMAVISSANLTYGGLKSNFEYGVLINKKEEVKTIKRDILEYSTPGFIYDKLFLTKIYEESKKIEHIQEKQIKQHSDKELKLLIEQHQKIETILVKQYENKNTRHSIFAKTIEYLLQKNKQLTTDEIYLLVKDLHPEMCNGEVKYKNGEKKWKIEIRQARFFLQRKGSVIQVSNTKHCWTLTNNHLQST